jgi:hypothetical protein
MTAAVDRRMPGVSFEVVPPELPDTLPRMDVAAFVGFASAGPLHVPVVVEDVERFRQVFGLDAPLARDAATGTVQHAHLGPAVEDFFRNGGRRCWVVRVADGGRAVRSRFPLAGLVAVGPTGGWRLAQVRARAVGGWADDLTVAPVLASAALPPVIGVDRGRRRLTMASDVPLSVGDLLRLTFDGGRTVALATVGAVGRAGTGLSLRWDRLRVLRPEFLASVPPSPVRAALVTVTGETALAEVPDVGMTDDPGRFVLTFARHPVPAAGDLLRITLDDGSVLAAPIARPAMGDRAVLTGPAWVLPPEAEAALPGPGHWPPVLELLTLSLTVWNGERLDSRIDGLGFDRQHPQYWAALPTDEQLFGAGGAASRFALAGPGETLAGEAAEWIPLAVADVAVPTIARRAFTDTSPDTRLTRDGLAVYGAQLFLDPDLAGQGTAILLEQAFAKSSIAVPARPLLGIHALLPIDEVSLLAVPDAGHLGWREFAEPVDPAPAPPVLRPPEEHDCVVTLWWTPVPPDDGYVVERSGRPDFRPATVLLDGLAPLRRAETGLPLPVAGCPTLVYLRVRATGGPWSNTVAAVLPPADFTGCGPGLPAPELRLEPDPTPGTGAALTWVPLAGLGTEIEQSADPVFGTVDARFTEPGSRRHVPAPEAADTYHRVRFADPGTGRSGPWSNTVVQLVGVRRLTRAEQPIRGQIAVELLAVQRAVLRMAGARGDLLAILSMAAHYRDGETVEHLTELTGLDIGSMAPAPPALVPVLDSGEAHVLGHAAVFHPWHVVRTVAGVRPGPPDGGLAGVLAHRSIVRGAWVSPGNQAVDSVVALSPALDADAVERLLAAGVNMVARRPAGFVTLTARTLGPDETTAPIGVRRLMFLLRRLALRHGTTYVFEPHGHRFRTMVRRTFESLLADLYQRGAFAGAVAGEAFRVVVDDTVNPEQLTAAGRFVVELWVAPAQPLVFVRVRLVQSGAGDLVALEV